MANPTNFIGRVCYKTASLIGIKERHEILFGLTTVFLAGVILASILRMLLIWCNAMVAFSVGGEISVKIFEITLNQPYERHISHSSGEVINQATFKASLVSQALIYQAFVVSSATVMSF